MAQYSHLSEMDTEIAAAVAQIPPQVHTDDIVEARHRTAGLIAMLHAASQAGLPPKSSYRVQEYPVPVLGGKINVRSVIPISDTDGTKFPLLLWFHGGGWTVGDIEMDDPWLRIVSAELKVSIVNVEYRLAPEFPFPTGLDDCFAALKWAAENVSLLQVSLDKGFVVGGSSAGANLAAAVALRARDDPFFKDKPLTGQVLEIPATIHPLGYPDKFKAELLSAEQNKESPTLRLDHHLKNVVELLKVPPTDPDFSVVLNPSHAGLPPTYFQVCGLDPLRDEGLLYEKLLRQAGVKTKLDVYPGLPHGAHLLFPQLSVSLKFRNDSKKGLTWLLDGTP